jgi:hypothetical protein
MVAAAPSGGMRELFQGLVPAEVIDAYDRLLAAGGCAKADVGAMVGGTDLVDALTGTGMAHVLPHSPADPPWLRPASPDLALQGVLAGHQAGSPATPSSRSTGRPAAARHRGHGPVPVHLRRRHDGRPGRPADHQRQHPGRRPGSWPRCR